MSEEFKGLKVSDAEDALGKLSDGLSEEEIARWIVSGEDRGGKIAAYALRYLYYVQVKRIAYEAQLRETYLNEASAPDRVD